MGMLVDGVWTQKAFPTDESGHFRRKPVTFRHSIEPGGRFEPESGRYHLYVSSACPWAHRTLIIRKLRGLEDHIGLSVVDSFMGEDGWFFSEEEGAIPDSLHGAKYLRDIYLQADAKFTGRVTVPILWDKKEQTIVNNESREIIRMMHTSMMSLGTAEVTYCPPGMEVQIDAAIDANYEAINNGVYRSGFARSQAAYEEAVS